MPLGLWNQEFLNANSQRAYPLADDADGQTDAGDFAIPTDFIVELDLAVPTALNALPGQFFILNIGSYASGYSVVVGYQPGSGPAVPVATALIASQLQGRNTVYALGGIAPFDDCVGKIVIGRLDGINTQPGGFWTFSLEHTRLDPDAIRPQIRGVSSITLVNNGQPSAQLYGDIELVAGTNCQLIPILVLGQNPQVQINAIQGEGLTQDCPCTDNVSPPIKTINVIGPTTGGDFTLIGNDCIQFQPIQYGLKVADVCAKPCCGCPELETVTRDLERLKRQASTVDDYVNRLGSSVENTTTNILGSKIGDQGGGG